MSAIRDALLADAALALPGAAGPGGTLRDLSGRGAHATLGAGAISAADAALGRNVLVCDGTSAGFAEAVGGGGTHTFTNTAWAFRVKIDAPNDPGSMLKIGWGAGGASDGWSFGQGDGGYAAAGSQAIYFRPDLQVHPLAASFGAGWIPCWVEFGSNSAVVIRVGGATVGADPYTVGVGPYGNRSGGAAAVRLGSFGTSAVQARFADVVCLPRASTADERAWYADPNNSLSPAPAVPVGTRLRTRI